MVNFADHSSTIRRLISRVALWEPAQPAGRLFSDEASIAVSELLPLWAVSGVYAFLIGSSARISRTQKGDLAY